jgi:hypothetical protein
MGLTVVQSRRAGFWLLAQSTSLGVTLLNLTGFRGHGKSLLNGLAVGLPFAEGNSLIGSTR